MMYPTAKQINHIAKCASICRTPDYPDFMQGIFRNLLYYMSQGSMSYIVSTLGCQRGDVIKTKKLLKGLGYRLTRNPKGCSVGFRIHW